MARTRTERGCQAHEWWTRALLHRVRMLGGVTLGSLATVGAQPPSEGHVMVVFAPARPREVFILGAGFSR